MGGTGEIEGHLRAVLAGQEQAERANTGKFGEIVALLSNQAGYLPRNGDIGRMEVDVVGDEWVTRADNRNARSRMREVRAAIRRALPGQGSVGKGFKAAAPQFGQGRGMIWAGVRLVKIYRQIEFPAISFAQWFRQARRLSANVASRMGTTGNTSIAPTRG